VTDLGLRGVNAAIPLPMHSDQSADFESFRSLCRWVRTQNVDAVTVNADTAEGAHLTLEERVRMVEVAKEELAPDIAVVSGLMAGSTSSAVATAQELKTAGADALLVFSVPAFAGLPLPDDMVTTYYQRVQDVGLPLIAFSLTPDLGGALLRGPVVTDLANQGLIVAIKDASFNPLQFLETRDALRASQSDVVLLTGCDNFIYESFLMGAEGILLGYASIAAPLTREVFELVRFGKTDEAEQLNRTKMQPLAQVMFGAPLRNSRGRIKAVLALKGIIAGETVREPLLPLPTDDREAMLVAARNADIL
jgi:4-hydroxy-tetrahydrodipicolinate synthase